MQLIFVALPPKDLSCIVNEIWFVVGDKMGKSQGISFLLMGDNPLLNIALVKLSGLFQ